MIELLERQKAYFATGATLPVKSRIAALKKLKAVILARESEINEALKKDLGKSGFESYMCEVGMTLSEISYMIKRVRRYSRDSVVPTPLSQYPAKSYVKKSPYGCVLIMSPWNYPFMLAMEPLADAIAAGNTAIVKPSAYSPATSAVVAAVVASMTGTALLPVIRRYEDWLERAEGKEENCCENDHHAGRCAG